jgi:replication-associated recombination protein RarA
MGNLPMGGVNMQLRTKGRYLLSEITSALIKCLRRGDEELALFFGLELLETFPHHFWKRMVLFCAEDVGLADPDAIVRVTSLWTAYQSIRANVGKQAHIDENLAVMALLYLARAPKHREVDAAKNWALERRERGWAPEIPLHALDVHTARGRQMGRTETDWWRDTDLDPATAWLPPGGFGKYEFYARLKQQGGELPSEAP